MGEYSERNNTIDWESGMLLFEVYKLAQEGYSNEGIAKKLGIHPDTLYSNMKKYAAVGEEIKKGRQMSFRNLVQTAENSSKKLIEGYSYTEQTIEQKEIGKDSKGKPVFETKKKVTKKEAGPNVAATLFILKTKGKYEKEQETNDKSNSVEITRRVVNSREDLEQKGEENGKDSNS